MTVVLEYITIWLNEKKMIADSYILLTQGCILTKLIVRLLPIISDIATCIHNRLFCQIRQLAIGNYFFQFVKFLVLSIVLAIRHDSLLGRCLVQLCSYRNLNLRQRKILWYTASYLATLSSWLLVEQKFQN